MDNVCRMERAKPSFILLALQTAIAGEFEYFERERFPNEVLDLAKRCDFASGTGIVGSKTFALRVFPPTRERIAQ